MTEYYIPVGEVVKSEPKSIGIETPRKKRPKELAVITSVHGLFRLARLCSLLPRGRLHVLGPRRGPSALRPD